ncbi:metal-independent phosphoserine phosphatase [Dioscorea cayenensis subsp. rotundata]|uniref:Metal-independent phosphoserine phosphatase n=1 Tax=Dioscorea cayennensis subsp. rotundata TaxID=55577 RepID=A0AB40BHR4_DIOCR|nr:metal-independent phosphoserine phosphatase [Dioscorea cayenensis subsp. rotundata]
MAGEAPLLRNSYWVLRHGKSIPNERGLIVSSLENGTLQEFGLAPEGIEQAKLAGELFNKELKEKNVLVENVRICYSPFSRTKQTAKEVAGALGIPFEGAQCKAMEALRERHFGPLFELLSHDKYAEIWALDEKDPFMSPEGGESVADVAFRLATALATIESEYDGCTILVVSHGDPLQILQTVIHAAREHSSSNAENIMARIKGVMVHSFLSGHRKFALLTGELRHVS